MRPLAALVLVPLLASCTTAFPGTPTPASSPKPPDSTVLHFRPVLAVSVPTTPTPVSGVPSVADPDTPALREARASRQDPELADASRHQPLVSTFTCPRPDPLAGRDDPALPLLTCGRDGAVYVLGPAELTREHVQDAEASVDPTSGGALVSIRFTIPGGVRWADFTSRNVGRQVAVVVNTAVLSAPTVQEAITGGSAQLSGQFTRAEAEELAARVTGG